jgi:hypothetical protein
MLQSILQPNQKNLYCASLTIETANEDTFQLTFENPALSQYKTTLEALAPSAQNNSFYLPDANNGLQNFLMYGPQNPIVPYPFMYYKQTLTANITYIIFTMPTTINTNYKIDMNIVVNNTTDRSYSSGEYDFYQISQGNNISFIPQILGASTTNIIDASGNLSLLNPQFIGNAGSYYLQLTGIAGKVINVLIEVKTLSI